jgi:hypothetical protein
MYPDKYRLTESAYIGEELFSDAVYDLERQCASVSHAEQRKLMSREEALEAFEVTPEQYTAYLARNTSHILWPAHKSVLSWTESVMTLQVLSANLMEFASYQTQAQMGYLKHFNAALSAMKQLIDEAEDQSRNTA